MENELVTKHNFIFYTSDNNGVKAKIILFDESLWMSQKMMAELFEVHSDTIGDHIKNIFSSKELNEESTTGNFPVVQTEGLREVERDIKHYNLDVIIAVGYRVNSKKATQFRIWSTKIIKEFMVKGFVLDDERLKQGEKFFEKDYFRELLERIRSIRASERRIWLQITDIFQECSTDYLKDSDTAQTFFQTVQNKFHYAITGQNAAEIIYSNADATKPKMNLKTFKNSPNGRVLKSDSEVAKNYLEEKEIKKLERTVSSFFDYIENLIENRNSFTMSEFVEVVDKFLSFNDFKILNNSGSITHKEAVAKAHKEYDEFNKLQKISNDFEKKILGK